MYICILLELSDYCDSTCYRDSLGLFMNKIINSLILAGLTDVNLVK